MCIIIHKPEGIKLADEIYEECWRIHDDGLGFAYVDPEKKKLVVDKGYLKKKEGLAALKKVEHLELLIHFRRVSRGKVSEENTHPFECVGEDEGVERYSFAIAHNGTIDIPIYQEKSDTNIFVQDKLGPSLKRDPWMLDFQSSKWMVERAIGERSKLVVFRYDNTEHRLKVYFLNEDKGGNKAHGCWFSNYSWYISKHQAAGEFDWEGGYHGGMGYGYNGANNNIVKHNQPWNGNAGCLPHQRQQYLQTKQAFDRCDGESAPDHLGWRWVQSRNMFVNEETKAMTDKLTYRKAYETKYVHDGREYDRLAREYKPGASGSVPVSIPASEESPKSDSKKPEDVPKDGQLHLIQGGAESGGGVDSEEPDAPDEPIDPDMLTDDEWDRQYNLGKLLSREDLRHLNKRERKELKAKVWKIIRDEFGSEGLACLNLGEMLKYVRHDFITAVPGARLWSIVELDRAIISYDLSKLEQVDKIN